MIGRILRRLPPTRSVLRKLAHQVHRSRVRRGRPTCGIDSPSPREPVTPYHVECSGWLHLGPDHDRIESIALVAGGATVAESRRLLRRPDVDAVLGLPDGTRTGFHLAGSAVGILEPGPRPHRADLVVRLAHEPQELTLRTIDQ